MPSISAASISATVRARTCVSSTIDRDDSAEHVRESRALLTWLLALSLLMSAAPSIGAAGPAASEPLWRRPVDLRGAFLCSSLCDLDGDGGPDVLVSERGREGPWRTIALSGVTGEEFWSREHERSAHVAASVDSGSSRVVFVAGTSLEVVDGATGVTRTALELESAAGRMELARLDGDCHADIVCAVGHDRDDRLVALSGADLSGLWVVDAGPDDSRFGLGFGRIMCADADADGLDEIFVVENTDALVRVDACGSRRWSRGLGERTAFVPLGAATSAPVVADLTGDGEKEVAIGCLAGGLVVLEAATGDRVALLRFGVEAHSRFAGRRRLPGHLRKLLAESGEPVNEMLPVELDGAPGEDLVFGCSDGVIYGASPRSGETLWRFDSDGKVYDAPLWLDSTQDGAGGVVAWDMERVYLLDGGSGAPLSGLPEITGPAELHLADVNGDGSLELVVVARNPARVEVWNIGATHDGVVFPSGGAAP